MNACLTISDISTEFISTFQIIQCVGQFKCFACHFFSIPLLSKTYLDLRPFNFFCELLVWIIWGNLWFYLNVMVNFLCCLPGWCLQYEIRVFVCINALILFVSAIVTLNSYPRPRLRIASAHPDRMQLLCIARKPRISSRHKKKIHIDVFYGNAVIPNVLSLCIVPNNYEKNKQSSEI